MCSCVHFCQLYMNKTGENIKEISLHCFKTSTKYFEVKININNEAITHVPELSLVFNTLQIQMKPYVHSSQRPQSNNYPELYVSFLCFPSFLLICMFSCENTYHVCLHYFIKNAWLHIACTLLKSLTIP